MPYKDKEIQRKYQRKWIAQRREDYFSDKSCVVCRSVDNLQLDHKDPKTKVSHRLWSWSRERRESELNKCQVLCEEHHISKTANDFSYQLYCHGGESTYRKGCRCSECINSHYARWKIWNNQRGIV